MAGTLCLLTANGQDFTYEAVPPENSSSDPTQKAASDQYKSMGYSTIALHSESVNVFKDEKVSPD